MRQASNQPMQSQAILREAQEAWADKNWRAYYRIKKANPDLAGVIEALVGEPEVLTYSYTV